MNTIIVGVGYQKRKTIKTQQNKTKVTLVFDVFQIRFIVHWFVCKRSALEKYVRFEKTKNSGALQDCCLISDINIKHICCLCFTRFSTSRRAKRRANVAPNVAQTVASRKTSRQTSYHETRRTKRRNVAPLHHITFLRGRERLHSSEAWRQATPEVPLRTEEAEDAGAGDHGRPGQAHPGHPGCAVSRS